MPRTKMISTPSRVISTRISAMPAPQSGFIMGFLPRKRLETPQQRADPPEQHQNQARAPRDSDDRACRVERGAPLDRAIEQPRDQRTDDSSDNRQQRADDAEFFADTLLMAHVGPLSRNE